MSFLNSPDKNGYCCKCEDHKDACTCYVCYTYNLCEESDQSYAQTVVVRGTSDDEQEGNFPVVGQVGEGGCYEQGDKKDDCDNTYDYEIADLTEMEDCQEDGCAAKECSSLTLEAYYLQEWWFHQCNYAEWDATLNGIALPGHVNLNNEEDGGSRYSTINVSAETVNAALEISSTLTLVFNCSLGGWWGCHSGLFALKVTGGDGTVLFDGGLGQETFVIPCV